MNHLSPSPFSRCVFERVARRFIPSLISVYYPIGIPIQSGDERTVAPTANDMFRKAEDKHVIFSQLRIDGRSRAL